MIIKEFNKKYRRQGGIKKLFKMKEDLETLKKIADQFGIGRESIRQWMIEFFKEPYDPRKERRKRKIELIENMIHKHGLKKIVDLYPGINRSYLKAAINDFKRQRNKRISQKKRN